jgi:hypothetical protein
MLSPGGGVNKAGWVQRELPTVKVLKLVIKSSVGFPYSSVEKNVWN